MSMISGYRYTLTVPYRDNNGKYLDDVHEYVTRYLGSEPFTGFTANDATGNWNGQHEDVIVYTVDITESPASEARLLNSVAGIQALARYVKETASQEAVYLTRSPILFELI